MTFPPDTGNLLAYERFQSQLLSSLSSASSKYNPHASHLVNRLPTSSGSEPGAGTSPTAELNNNQLDPVAAKQDAIPIEQYVGQTIRDNHSGWAMAAGGASSSHPSSTTTTTTMTSYITPQVLHRLNTTTSAGLGTTEPPLPQEHKQHTSSDTPSDADYSESDSSGTLLLSASSLSSSNSSTTKRPPLNPASGIPINVFSTSSVPVRPSYQPFYKDPSTSSTSTSGGGIGSSSGSGSSSQVAQSLAAILASHSLASHHHNYNSRPSSSSSASSSSYSSPSGSSSSSGGFLQSIFNPGNFNTGSSSGGSSSSSSVGSYSDNNNGNKAIFGLGSTERPPPLLSDQQLISMVFTILSLAPFAVPGR